MSSLEFKVSLNAAEGEAKVYVARSPPARSAKELLSLLAKRERPDVSAECLLKTLRALSKKDVIEVQVFDDSGDEPKLVGTAEVDLSGSSSWDLMVIKGVLAHSEVGKVCNKRAWEAVNDSDVLEKDLEKAVEKVEKAVEEADPCEIGNLYEAFKEANSYDLEDVLFLASKVLDYDRAEEVYQAISKYEGKFTAKLAEEALDSLMVDVADSLTLRKAKLLASDSELLWKSYVLTYDEIKRQLKDERLAELVAKALALEHPWLRSVGDVYVVAYPVEAHTSWLFEAVTVPLRADLPKLKKSLFIYEVRVTCCGSHEPAITMHWYKLTSLKSVISDSDLFEDE